MKKQRDFTIATVAGLTASACGFISNLSVEEEFFRATQQIEANPLCTAPTQQCSDLGPYVKAPFLVLTRVIAPCQNGKTVLCRWTTD
ncbi:MAG: hypothetical protein AAFO77_01845 [Pseudomonadota bacterium]